MNTVGFVIAVAAVIAVTAAWPYQDADDDYSSWRMTRSQRRTHHCTGSGSKCFSTTDCCKGYVCAAFDDYFGRRGQRSEGMNPEIPGFCVKEKDLQPCFSTRDCDPHSKCVSLGRDREMYCVRLPEPLTVQEILEEMPIINVPSANQFLDEGGKGGLGNKCKDNSDCRSFDKAGSQLCCQRISRGRQGIKVICDRVTAISKCIAG